MATPNNKINQINKLRAETCRRSLVRAIPASYPLRWAVTRKTYNCNNGCVHNNGFTIFGRHTRTSAAYGIVSFLGEELWLDGCLRFEPRLTRSPRLKAFMPDVESHFPLWMWGRGRIPAVSRLSFISRHSPTTEENHEKSVWLELLGTAPSVDLAIFLRAALTGMLTDGRFRLRPQATTISPRSAKVPSKLRNQEVLRTR